MRLYLYAESKNKIGYIPDWLKFSYKNNEQNFDLVLDIQGEIGYDTDCLNCRCKGVLIPWVHYKHDSGEETNLYDHVKEEVDNIFPIKRVAELLKIGTDFRVGVYPVNSSEDKCKLAQEDILSDCKGICEIFDGENEYEIRFNFETEFNE